MSSLPPRHQTPEIRLVAGEVARATDPEPAVARYRRPLSPVVFRLASLLVMCVFLGLAFRLTTMAYEEGPPRRARWESSQARTETRLPPRGQIYDRHGVILGETLATFDCYAVANRKQIDERILPVLATMIAEASGHPAADIERILQTRSSRAEIFRDMSPELAEVMLAWRHRAGWRRQAHAFAETEAGKHLIAQAFEGNKTEWFRTLSHAVGNVVVQPVDRRHYPLGSLAGQVLGFVTERPDGIAPGGGIELSSQQQLAGDQPSVPVHTAEDAPLGKPALGVKLTLDADVQAMTEQALARGLQRTRSKAAVAIVMDADTGDLLALANVPVFDPAIYQAVQQDLELPDHSASPGTEPLILASDEQGEPVGPGEVDAPEHAVGPRYFESWPLSATTLDNWTDPMPAGLIPGISETHRRNAALAWQVEPGSIFKPFTMLAALEHGTARPTDTFVIGPAPMRLGNFQINDHHPPAQNEVWDATRVMVKSSNKGMAKIALDTGPDRMLKTMQRLHFGERLLNFPGEGPGRIGLDEERWAISEIGSYGYGHGLIMTTPLQLTAAMNAIATGSYVRPRLVMATERPDGRWREEPPASREATLDPIAIAHVQHMMEAVVSEEGTGRQAAVEGFQVAGKTGTAKKPGPGGYVSIYYSSFLGYGPVEAPRYTVLVMYDEPQIDKYGGLAAAPVFSEIMTWLLQRDIRRPPEPLPAGSTDSGVILARR